MTGGAGEQRAEGGPGGAGSPPCQFAVLLGHLQWGSWLFCLLGCWVFCDLLILLPSSLPGWSEAIDKGQTGSRHSRQEDRWCHSEENHEEKQDRKMINRHQDEVSLCLPYRQQDTAHSRLAASDLQSRQKTLFFLCYIHTLFNLSRTYYCAKDKVFGPVTHVTQNTKTQLKIQNQNPGCTNTHTKNTRTSKPSNIL